MRFKDAKTEIISPAAYHTKICDICGSSDNRHIKDRICLMPVIKGVCEFKHYDVICNNCGYIFNLMPPDDKFLEYYYLNTRTKVAADYAWKKRLQYIKLIVKPGNRIIEYGSNRGEFVRHLRNAGYIVDDLDIGEDYTGQVRYDLALCYYVLEHVAHPREFIRSIKRLLKPEGQIIIEVPDCGRNMTESLYGEHLCHFTQHHLVSLLISEGFLISNVIVKHSRNFGVMVHGAMSLWKYNITNYERYAKNK